MNDETNFTLPKYPKGATPEQKREVNKQRAAVMRKAQGVAIAFLKVNLDQLSLDETQKKALDLLFTKRERAPRGSAVQKVPVGEKLAEYFTDTDIVEDGRIADVEVFVSFRLSVSDVVKALRQYNGKCDPAKRLWVNYDGETREYTVLGSGPIPPDGYTGPLPLEKKEA